jgi:hypothetical protein
MAVRRAGVNGNAIGDQYIARQLVVVALIATTCH